VSASGDRDVKLFSAAAAWLVEGFATSARATHATEEPAAEPVQQTPVRQKPVLRLIITAPAAPDRRLSSRA